MSDEPAPFKHDKLVARYPSGTDVRAAIRDALAVFMERVDGSNPMDEVWTTTRWWHGSHSGFRKGQQLLPPSQTGVLPGLPITDKDSVYITSDRRHALSFAARHNRPMLYEVTFDVEPQPDDIIPDEPTSGRVPSCYVHRIEVPSALELRRVLYELNS